MRCRRHHFVEAHDPEGRCELFVCDRCGAWGGHPKTVYARGRIIAGPRGRRVTILLASRADRDAVRRVLAARGRRAPATIYADLAPHWRRS